ncbi:MAG: alanine racemase [Candidatus Limnocylindria bacterium]
MSAAIVASSSRSRHRAWIEVDLAAVARNLGVLRRLGREGQQVIGVVKANAYGHGDVEIARTLVGEGVDRLAVATVDEGIRLRQAGIDAPILVLFEMDRAEAARAVAARLEATIFTDRGVAALSHAATARRTVAVHVKVDTGLGRQGADPADALALATSAVSRPEIELAGTYTHLAVPGEDEAYTDLQLVRFGQVLDALRGSAIDPGLVHVSGTGGVLSGVGGFADAIRPGLGLYGMAPSWASADDIGLRPALSLRSLPLRIFDLAGGEPIGYGLRFRAGRRSRIATLGMGYADGWPRVHANNGVVLVRGKRAPIVGAISMDALTVDVTDVDGVTEDDEFVLIGSQDGERITADEVAAQRRTINYEVTTALGIRLSRMPLASGRRDGPIARVPSAAIPGAAHGGV